MRVNYQCLQHKDATTLSRGYWSKLLVLEISCPNGAKGAVIPKSARRVSSFVPCLRFPVIDVYDYNYNYRRSDPTTLTCKLIWLYVLVTNYSKNINGMECLDSKTCLKRGTCATISILVT